jgi:hypothetical protein
MSAAEANGLRASISGKWISSCEWLMALGLLASAGCSPAQMPAVNPPSGVVRFTEERGFDTAVAVAEVDLLLALRPSYGRLEAQRWKVPRSLSWEQLVAYYGGQLGPDWKPDPHQPEQASGYRRRVWHRDGALLQHESAFALAYLAEVPADFALLIVAQSARD